MTNLAEDLQDLLDAERDIDVPAPAERQRMFSRLEPLLIVPIAVAVGSSSATTADATASAVGGFLKGKVLAAVVSAAMVGGAVGATGHAYFAAPIPPSARSSGGLLPSAVPRTTNVTPEAPRASSDEPEAAPSATAAPSPSAARPARSQVAGSLRAERLLLEAASAALMRGDPESAIPALRKHAQRFPAGALAEEREALLERALAASRKPR